MLDMMSEVELAKELGKAKSTLQRWRRDGTGPRWARVGAKVVYSAAAVQEWLDRGGSPRSECKAPPIPDVDSLPF